MLEKLYEKLNPYAQWKYVLIGLAISTFINVVAFPLSGKKLREVSPDAVGPIDLRFSYSPDEVYQMVESYGDRGREIYAMSTIGIDIIYPIVYTIVFILILLILFKKTSLNKEGFNSLAFIPLITFFADIFENTGIVLMLKNFPERMDSLASMTSIFSSIKWTFVGVTVLMILFLALKLLFSKNK